MAFKPSDWSESGLPIIRIQNLNNAEASFNYFDGEIDDRFRVVKGDLLFAWSGTPGTSFGAHIWTGPEAVLNQHIFKVDFDRAAIDAEYLCYAINQTLGEQISKAHGGVGLQHVTKEAFSSTKIPLPPLKEQVRLARDVAKLVAQASKGRELLQGFARLAEKSRQSLLVAAFDGEISAKWRASHQNIENAARLLDRVPAPDQPRGGRDATSRVIAGRAGISVNVPDVRLPSGWQWVSLRRIARQETGHTPSRRNPEYWGGRIPWLGIRDASTHHGAVITDTQQKITKAGLDNSSARILPARTVCLSRTASVGYVTILGREMATSQDFATWSCSEALQPEYLMYALMSEGQSIRRFGEGTVHTTIYFPEIRAFHIRLAPIEEQAVIVAAIRSAFAQIDAIVREAERATELIDVLEREIMKRAFEGGLSRAEVEDGSAIDAFSNLKPPVLARRLVGAPGSKGRGIRSMLKSLQKVLEEADDWLTAQEVFRRCGVANGAETDTIEQLFAELRLLDQNGRLLVEPVLDSKGRKTQDRLRLNGKI